MSGWEYANWYRDGEQWVVVQTGMPEQHTRVGVGDTPGEAWDALESTAIQSVGRDCGLSDTIEWCVGAGWLNSVDLEETDAPEAEACDEEGES
jgi:hypothetical protein